MQFNKGYYNLHRTPNICCVLLSSFCINMLVSEMTYYIFRVGVKIYSFSDIFKEFVGAHLFEFLIVNCCHVVAGIHSSASSSSARSRVGRQPAAETQRFT